MNITGSMQIWRESFKKNTDSEAQQPSEVFGETFNNNLCQEIIPAGIDYVELELRVLAYYNAYYPDLIEGEKK